MNQKKTTTQAINEETTTFKIKALFAVLILLVLAGIAGNLLFGRWQFFALGAFIGFSPLLYQLMRSIASDLKKSKEDLGYKKQNNIYLKCYLLGHRISDNDSGHAVCGCCGMHEYYDNIEDIREFPKMNDYPFYSPLSFWFYSKISRPTTIKLRTAKSWFVGLFNEKNNDLPF